MRFAFWSYGPEFPPVWGISKEKIDGVPTVFFNLGSVVFAIEFDPKYVDWN